MYGSCWTPKGAKDEYEISTLLFCLWTFYINNFILFFYFICFFHLSTGIANTRVFGGFGVAVVDIIMTILAEFANKAPSFSLNSLTMTKLCNYHKYPWLFLIFTHVLCGLICHFIPSLLLKRSFHFIMYLWICPWFRSSYVSFWAPLDHHLNLLLLVGS